MRDLLRRRPAPVPAAGSEPTSPGAPDADVTSAPTRPRPVAAYVEDPWGDPPRADDADLSGDDVAAGLDALEEAPRRKRLDVAAIIAPILAVLGLLALWQLAVTLEVRPVWILPGPADVWQSLTVDLGWAAAGEAVWTSLSRGVVGVVLAVLLGTLVGLFVGQVRVLRLAFRPLLVAMQSLPSVAWVPAAILWFGLTDLTMYAVILLGAVPSIAMGLIGGLDQTPPLLSRAGRVLGANRVQMVRHVLLPAALPAYLTGVKQGWAFSWRSLMAAEIIVRSPQLGLGLGQLLNQGRDLSDVSLVVVAVLLVLVVGIAIDTLVFSPVERAVLRRRGLA